MEFNKTHAMVFHPNYRVKCFLNGAFYDRETWNRRPKESEYITRLRSENAELREALRQSMPPIVTEATQLKALKASLAELAEKWSELGEGNECHHYNQCGDELRAKLKG